MAGTGALQSHIREKLPSFESLRVAVYTAAKIEDTIRVLANAKYLIVIDGEDRCWNKGACLRCCGKGRVRRYIRRLNPRTAPRSHLHFQRAGTDDWPQQAKH
jgi:hypothetical protein